MEYNNPTVGLGETKPDLSLKMTNETDEKVSIIVVHNDKPAHLNICLQTISVCSLNSNYEIVIVDNGSKTKDALDFLDELEKQEDCKVVRNKENLLWAKAANQGVKAAGQDSKYLIFLHHDVNVLNPAWIDMLINVSESQDSGLVGVSMSSYSMEDVTGKRNDYQFIEEWCMLTTRECWNDCGPFNEKLEQIGAPFMYTLAATWHNYKPQMIRNALVHHYGVFAMDVNDLERYNEKAMSVIPSLIRELQLKMNKES